jgi:hypothetical protein
MRDLNRFVCVAAVALLAFSDVNAAGSEAGESAAALLERLRAKDNAFDNAVLRYAKSEDWLLHDTPWRFPPDQRDKNEVKDQGPTVIKLRNHEQMVVRGRETTFISEADPEMKRLNRGARVTPYRKWGVAEGVFKEISDMRGAGPPDFLYETKKADGPGDLVLGERRGIEFSHGFGFGKRIKAIDSVVPEGNKRIIKGTIQLWSEDVSNFRIELGDDLVVKKAVIDCDAQGNLTRYEITTEGAVERRGFVFAQSGRVRRTPLGMKNGPKPTLAETEEFWTRFVAVRFNLEKDAYEALTRIELLPGTLVRDQIANQAYQVEKDGTVKDLGVGSPR